MYFITKLKKDRSDRFVLHKDKVTWIRFSESVNAAFVSEKEANVLIKLLAVSDEYYYLKTTA